MQPLVSCFLIFIYIYSYIYVSTYCISLSLSLSPYKIISSLETVRVMANHFEDTKICAHLPPHCASIQESSKYKLINKLINIKVENLGSWDSCGCCLIDKTNPINQFPRSQFVWTWRNKSDPQWLHLATHGIEGIPHQHSDAWHHSCQIWSTMEIILLICHIDSQSYVSLRIFEGISTLQALCHVP